MGTPLAYGPREGVSRYVTVMGILELLAQVKLLGERQMVS